MTLANRITLTRIFLSFVVFFLILEKTFVFELLAMIILIIAMLSDYIDGKIAKSTNTVTRFGAIADPFADKILVLSCFIAFASIKDLNIPLWAIFLIMLRELTVSTLRVLAALQNFVLKAEAAGKFKTLIQFISIYIILIILTLKYYSPQPLWIKKLLPYLKILPYWLSVTAAVVTVISGIIYLINHNKMLKESWSEKKSK
ncbi:MAG: CDP-diacylglycerol--glycerol-3-phosphate 3-phosphatidyltransferase [Elusimicrobia bacterium CG08_land_8_20_14_0_20_51_18]|nr:MAG: CDP-diacylglycerol--glycerol-3-phosphate 3-phosphatidyltransferase [Elusimicrobia bacterium CG08_land_8_20_14_0_20_51_18]